MEDKVELEIMIAELLVVVVIYVGIRLVVIFGASVFVTGNPLLIFLSGKLDTRVDSVSSIKILMRLVV